jgi:membrane protein
VATLTFAAYVAGRRTGNGAATPRPSVRELMTSREAARRRSPSGRAGGPSMPGIDAQSPLQIPRAGWWQILRRAWAEQQKDNVGLIAAGIAYYAFTALFPALIAAVTLYGLVADPAQVVEQTSSLTSSLPQDAKTLITGQLTTIANGSSGALGVGLVVGVLGALFSASGGVGSLIKAINIAYDEQETRGFVKLRSLALLLTVGAVLFVVVAIGLIAVLPVVVKSIGLGAVGTAVAFVLRWVGLVVGMTVALGVLYRLAPDRDAPKLRWVGLGAVVATVLWIVASAGLSLYVSHFGSYGKTYGALAGVVVLLLWLYITAFIVLLGAEINSESEQQTARDTTMGPELPMGQRQAVKADSVAG